MSVIPFPFVPSRPILQPSIHARGARPYRYLGRIDEWHAPGASLGRDGATQCAVDAAWIVEQVLGAPAVGPKVWPGVFGAAERAREMAQTVKTVDAPNGLAPYQQEGAAFLASRDYAALLDVPGLGKTSQAIIAAEARLSLAVVPSVATPVVLVLCPALAKRHWQREIKKWAGHESTVLEGLKPDVYPETRYVIANYDILYGQRRRDAAGVMHANGELPGWGDVLAGRFLIVVCDESHILRGRSSRRAKSLKQTLRGVPVVWLLTGTPMPNHVKDLWTQIDLMSDGLAGGYWEWAKKYCDATQGKYGMMDTGSSNLDELARRMSFYMLGRSQEAAQLELPEKRREVFYVDVEMSAPTPKAAHEALVRQRVVANALRATGRAKRGIAIQQALEALQAKQKVIVFTYMREQADAIAKGVKDAMNVSVFCVHGDLSPEGRDAQAITFQQSPGPACFVATIDSIGMAISLVGASLMIVADLVYEPWKFIQMEKRAHRRGGTTRLLVRYLIATGTIDEGIVETVIAKLAAIEEAMGKDADASDLTGMLGPNPVDQAAVIDNLFLRLRGQGREA